MAQSFITDGEDGAAVRAKLNDRWQVLAQSSVAVSGAADTVENVLATVAIPAGAMGANGRVRITTLWTTTNSANNKTLRVKFGGTTYMSTVVTTAASTADMRQIGNRNSQASQVGSPTGTTGLGGTSGALVTSTVDTSGATSIQITGQKATAGEVLTLESYFVELLYAA